MLTLHLRRDVRATLTPREFAAHNVAVLRHCWRGIRDGDVECIHEARVATRRIRAALGVVSDRRSAESRHARKLGRALGRVREMDVTHELVTVYAARVPAATAVIAEITHELDRTRSKARRRLVKMLDDFDVRPLARLRHAEHFGVLKFWKDWRAALRSDVGGKSAALLVAVEHATAVYMPNRLHRVRIALKKLRYAMEVAEAAGMSVDETAARDARKLQDVLGRMHDLHVTLRLVRDSGQRLTDAADELSVLEAVIGAECAELHGSYVARRDRLIALGDFGRAFASSSRAAFAAGRVLRALPAAGVAAVPLAIWQLSAGTPSR